jgi:hypothetical protein
LEGEIRLRVRLGGGRIPPQPVSNPKFPDNREFNREFFDFGPFCAILAPNRRANSDGYNKIPYAAEQGIFSGGTGNVWGEQGISAEQQGSGIRDWL